MASRQQQKQRAREERLARETAERQRAARRKRGLYAAGGVLAAGLAVMIASVALGLSEGDGGDNSGQPGLDASAELPVLPEQREGELTAAAKAAGCKVKNAALEGQNHEERTFKASDYGTNPPTSGAHTPDWYEDGIYLAGDHPGSGSDGPHA